MTRMELVINDGDAVIAAFPWRDHVVIITQRGHVWRIDAWEEFGTEVTDLQAQRLK